MEQSTSSSNGHVNNNGYVSQLPRPNHDQKQKVFGSSNESRKHPLPTDDDPIETLDRHDRQLNFPLYPPPLYQPRDAPLPFSGIETTELPPIQTSGSNNDDIGNRVIHFNGSSHSNGSAHNNHTLPSLSTITASASSSQRPEPAYSSPAPPALTHWPSLNPLTAYYTPSHVQDPEPPLRMDVDNGSNSGRSTMSTASPDRFHDGRASSVSLDDPEVRMAAEALGELRADFVSSPIHRATPSRSRSPHSLTIGPQPEPLLSLLTTAHPFLATTIDNATSAYTNSKNYYPRIKTSIEYVEGYVIPLANTVGSVGRVTGVENGVRWFLRRVQPPGGDMEGQGSNKRRKVGNGANGYQDGDSGSGTQTPRASMEISDDRRTSMDTLPAYDEFRSPPYTEHGSDGPHGQAWQSRLMMMSTSGLSIAMTEESLRCLKYCLGRIRWANDHIGAVINTLTITMEKYEQTRQEPGDSEGASNREQETRSQLAARVDELRSDILKTLQAVIDTVSQYAGGALPDNARDLVRRHLTSLPQRFHIANMASGREAGRTEVKMEEGRSEQEQREETETRESARRIIVLAKEGLDMMSQVSGVLNGTLMSAEEWCERLGKEKREQREDLGASHTPVNDSKTG